MRKMVEIKGVGEALAMACAEKGYRSVQDIAEATVAELATVPGVSRVRAEQLIDSAQLLLDGASPSGTEFVANAKDEAGTPVDSAQAPSEDASPSETTPLASDKDEEGPPIDSAQAPSGTEFVANAKDEAGTPVDSVQAPSEDTSLSETTPLASVMGQPDKKKKNAKNKSAKSKKDRKKSEAKEKKKKRKKNLKDKKKKKKKNGSLRKKGSSGKSK